MSKIKIINPSSYEIAMMTHIHLMPATGAYEKVKSTTSRMEDTFSTVIAYRSY